MFGATVIIDVAFFCPQYKTRHSWGTYLLFTFTRRPFGQNRQCRAPQELASAQLTLKLDQPLSRKKPPQFTAIAKNIWWQSKPGNMNKSISGFVPLTASLHFKFEVSNNVNQLSYFIFWSGLNYALSLDQCLVHMGYPGTPPATCSEILFSGLD